MLKFWSVNYIYQVCKLHFYFKHVRNFREYFYLSVFSKHCVLLLALVKYILCSYYNQNCILLYFLEAKNPYFVRKNCQKYSYICVLILSKKRSNWFHKNLHNWGMVGCRKLPNPSLNGICNALSIGVRSHFNELILAWSAYVEMIFSWNESFKWIWILYMTFRSSHRRCSIKIVLVKISQNSQEST